MDKNLKFMWAIMVLYLGEKKVGASLYAYALYRRTEEFYHVIRTYRAHAIVQAR